MSDSVGHVRFFDMIFEVRQFFKKLQLCPIFVRMRISEMSRCRKMEMVDRQLAKRRKKSQDHESNESDVDSEESKDSEYRFSTTSTSTRGSSSGSRHLKLRRKCTFKEVHNNHTSLFPKVVEAKEKVSSFFFY